MIYIDIDIDPADIMHVIPQNNRVILRPLKKYASIASNIGDASLRYHLCVNDVDDESMAKIKFEYIRYIKKLPNPANRVADFEILDDNGFPDFEKEQRLIESRKTRKEREVEIKEYLHLIDRCDVLNLDSTVFKDALKRKLGGME